MQVFFVMTIIFALIEWTELARVVRGRFLSLREEDFVMAAELAGCSRPRIIFRHMVPSFLSHIIAATTLALPAIIIFETSLSFLGLGLRPPAISWGVMLQQASNVQTLAISPWLLCRPMPVIVAILAFNFLGDGLRDAADPYSTLMPIEPIARRSATSRRTSSRTRASCARSTARASTSTRARRWASSASPAAARASPRARS